MAVRVERGNQFLSLRKDYRSVPNSRPVVHILPIDFGEGLLLFLLLLLLLLQGENKVNSYTDSDQLKWGWVWKFGGVFDNTLFICSG